MSKYDSISICTLLQTFHNYQDNHIFSFLYFRLASDMKNAYLKLRRQQDRKRKLREDCNLEGPTAKALKLSESAMNIIRHRVLAAPPPPAYETPELNELINQIGDM